MTGLRIIPAKTEEDIEIATVLFVEYQNSLEFDLSFQDFEQELANLPGRYAPPDGCILLAEYEGQVRGCVALRNLGNAVCEMKRLYVREDYRGLGIGRHLCEALIDAAKKLDYHFMRLNFISPRPVVQALYESLGFEETERYEQIPLDGAVFMERKLR